MSSAEEKIGECVVCCHRCGGFLMESASTTSYIVCPECGARLVVCVKKGKVSVFDDNRSEEELAKKRHARLTGYAAKLNKLGNQRLKREFVERWIGRLSIFRRKSFHICSLLVLMRTKRM